jgi:hypothetical protein
MRGDALSSNAAPLVRGALNAKTKPPAGPPMDLANMRRQGVHHLIAYRLNDSCRHQALIDVKHRSSKTTSP